MPYQMMFLGFGTLCAKRSHGGGYRIKGLSPQFCLRKFEVRFKLGANNEVKPNTKE